MQSIYRPCVAAAMSTLNTLALNEFFAYEIYEPNIDPDGGTSLNNIQVYGQNLSIFSTPITFG